MHYIADLHVHSHYARATSKDLNLATLYQWAMVKGIHLVATGDFTHPQWFQELKTQLIAEDSGFFRLKNPPPPLFKCQPLDVRFCLGTEISTIYKHDGQVRKNHTLLYAPDLATVAKLNATLATIGNLTADGRPILGLATRDLLEIVLTASDQAYMIPAHIWTPWFSTLGAKSGYNSIDACFRDLKHHIFALETGLSSDPAMNERWSALDRYTLVSNSDAHSPQKLGREANLVDTAFTYEALFNALKTKQGWGGTLEFFPQEGKYYLDGHRACGIRLEPTRTQQHQGTCPTCHKPLTIGVLHRVVALADRTASQRPAQAASCMHLIPLPEILAEIHGTGPTSKRVQQSYQQLIALFGNEFNLLRHVPIDTIQQHLGPVYATAIQRLRHQQVYPNPGYDGRYGTIRLFQPGEIAQLTGQLFCFATAPKKRPAPTQPEPISKAPAPTQPPTQPEPISKAPAPTQPPAQLATQLHAAQQAVIARTQGNTLVQAGPGTGKTHTLIHWIANLLTQSPTAQLLAITFTNQAAQAMRQRLTTQLGHAATRVQVSTFHALGYQLLKTCQPDLQTLYDDEDRRLAIQVLFPDLSPKRHQTLTQVLAYYFETGEDTENLAPYAQAYQAYLQARKAVDIAAIIKQVLSLWQPPWPHYDAIAVDELQDINPLQYQLLCQLGQQKPILAIGDANQAIYTFRGAAVAYFFRFKTDFQAHEIQLTQNYRTTQTIVAAATALLPSPLTTLHPPGEKISLVATPTAQAEAAYIVQQIKRYIGGVDNLALGYADEGHYTFADLAILFRQRKIGKYLFEHLKKAGIPAHFSDGTSWIATPPFCLLIDLLQLALQPTALTALHRFLTHGLQWPLDWIHPLLATQRGLPPKAPAALPHEAQHTYHTWLAWYQTLVHTLQHHGLVAAIQQIQDQYLPSLDTGQQLQQATLLALAKQQPDAQAFLHSLLLSPYIDAGRLQGEGVHLLTFHAAKGLEFPIVFILGAEEGITPMHPSQNELAEEKRLFYVALTRAKEKVHLTYTQRREHYGQLKINTPSRFLQALPAHLTTCSQLPTPPAQQRALF